MADPSIGTSGGTFPIHTAAANGLSEVVKYMIKRGDYTTRVDAQGELALGHAVQGDDVATMQALLKHGCDVSWARGHHGGTAGTHAPGNWPAPAPLAGHPCPSRVPVSPHKS